MRKILNLILCITIIFGVTQTGIYAAEGTGSTDKYEYFDMAVFAFKNIGALSSDADVDSLANKEMSRAQFADILAKTMNLNSEDKTYFSDVKSDYWAVGSIAALAERGVISMSPENSFEPDRAITYEEACKMLLCTTGYGSYADATGGFPYGYTKIATRLKLNTDISSPNALTYNDAVALLWKGINMGIYEPSSINSDGEGAFNVSDETLLGTYHNLYYNTGRLESCFGGRIKNYVAEDNEIVIDGTTYLVSDNFDGLGKLGREVNYLYKTADDNTKSTVLYIDTFGTNERITEILIEDLKSFSDDSYTVSYYKNNQSSDANISISKSATIVYNGEIYKEKLGDLFAEMLTHNERGKITIINSDGAWDLVIIEKVHPVHVSAFTYDEVIFNTYNTAERIDIKNADSVIKYDQDGERADYEINLNDIYQVAVSKNGKRIKLRKLLSSTNGAVSSTEGDSIIVNGNKLDIDKYCLEYRKMPELNVSYSFVLDEYGYVVSYEKSNDENAFKFGYIIDYSKTDGFDPNLKIKIYTQDKNMNIYTLKSKCTVNADSYTADAITDNPSIIADADGKIKQQLVRFKANKDNEITEIDTTKLGSKEEADESLRKETAKHSGDAYMRSMRPNGILTLDREHLINESQTIVFEVPTMDKEGYLQAANYFSGNSNYTTYSVEYVLDASGNKISVDDSMYAIGSLGDSDARRRIDVYYCGDDDAYTPCVVWHKDIAFMISDPFVYGGTQDAIDDNGNIIKNVILTTYWGKVAYKLNDEGMANITAKVDDNGKSSIVPLEIGDVVQVATDRNNTIYKMNILYSRKYDSFNNNWSGYFGAPHGNWLTGYEQIFGDVSTNILRTNVVKRSGTILYLDSDNDGKGDINIDATNIKILVFDKDDAKNDYVRTGSISDIMDAKTSGQTGDTVLDVMCGHRPIYIYVYK